MASGQIITDYLSYGSGAPASPPSLAAAGQIACYENTATGDLYLWNPVSSAWVQVGRGTGPATIFGTAHEIGVSQSGSQFTLSTPQAIDTTSGVVFGSLELNGINSSVALGRWCGAVNGSAPSSGSNSLGDWYVDLAGGFYICTAGGTPGTFAHVAGAAPTTPNAAQNTYTGTKVDISSTSFTDIKSSLDITLSTAARRVYLSLTIAAWTPASAGLNTYMTFSVDGTNVGGANGLMELGATNGVPAQMNYLTAVLTAGSHTFKAMAKAQSASATFEMIAGQDSLAVQFAAMETLYTS